MNPNVFLSGIIEVITSDATYNAQEFARRGKIHIHFEPEGPDEVVTLYKTGDAQPPNPKFLLDYPSFQVRSRGKRGSSPGDAIGILYDMRQALLGVASRDLRGFRLVSVLVSSDIATLGVDGNRRAIFTLNFNCIVEPDADSYTNRIPL